MISIRFPSLSTSLPHWLRRCAAIAGIALVAGCATTPSPDPGHTACERIDDAGIDRLFKEWNDAVVRRNVIDVVDLYAPRSVLLPTLSREPRIARDRKIAYFNEFLALGPSGSIETSMKFSDCNIAVNAGTYTFTFDRKPDTRARYTYTYGWDAAQRRWLITSHHSSAEPKDPAGASSGDAASSSSGFETSRGIGTGR